MRLYVYLAVALIASCSTIDDLRVKVDTAPECCKKFAEMKFEPIDTNGDTPIVLNEQSPVFAFATGKSYFKAVDLGAAPPKRIAIWSNRTGSVAYESQKYAQVYCPSVQLLGPGFEPLKYAERSSVVWASRGMFIGSAFVAPFEVPPGTRYAVFYANPSNFGGLSYLSIGRGVSLVGSIPVPTPASSLAYPCGPVADANLEVLK